MNSNQTNRFIRGYRIFRVALHILRGLLTAALFFPLVDKPRRSVAIRRWSARLVKLLNVRVTVRGPIPNFPGQGVMLVANHVSWLDVYLIDSICPAHFIAKSEMQNWPVFGWFAEKIGTLFIERAKRRDTARINRHLADLLRQGDYIALFPEGTTSNGAQVRTFHGSLIQPAVDSNAMLCPVGIRYLNADGSINFASAYIDDMSLWVSLQRVVSQKTLYVEMIFTPAIPTQGRHRRELAAQAHAAILAAVFPEMTHTVPEKPADLPGALRTDVHPKDSHYQAPLDSAALANRVLTNAQK